MTKTQTELRLDRVLAKRENLFRRVQLCYEAGQALKQDKENKIKLENFSIRYSTLSKTVVDYRDIVQDIVTIKQEIKPNENPDYGILDAFEDLYDNIEYIAAEFINVKTYSTNNDNKNKPRINMPKIELVKFDGEDLTLWPLFYENFRHLVHLQPEFSKAEKLQYLVGSLLGKALKTCNAVEATPNNYDIIWKLLEDTYNDKKYLSSLYLDRLLNFRSLSDNNPTTLQLFLENFDTNVVALKRLELVDLADYMLTYIAMLKLSHETVKSFELVRSSQELPKYNELINFIRQQSKVILKMEKSRQPHNKDKTSFNNHNYSKNSKAFVINNINNGKICTVCQKGVHLFKDCSTFKINSPEENYKLVKERNLCLNCFSSTHKVKACPSKFSCNKCRAKHHTLLHRNDYSNNRNISPNPNIVPNVSNTQDDQPSTSTDNLHSLCAKINLSQVNKRVVLLSTASVVVVDRWNKRQIIRFLIDSGSMSNLLTVECCKKLGLSYHKLDSHVIGIGGTVNPLKGRTNLVIYSNINPNIKYPIEVLLVDKVTNFLPEVNIDTGSLNHLDYLPLADPTYHTPGVIDGILGASIFAEIIGSHRVTGITGTPTAIQTTLGYVVSGPAFPIKEHSFKPSYCTFLSLDALVEKMWEMEDFTPKVSNSEDSICENVFKENVSRDSSGRYTVALPFKDDPIKLGNSFSLAQRRLFYLEKRLEKSPELREMYSSIIQDYINQGHMSLVPKEQIDVPSYFIPHHCVFKPDSVSTPCRIVFDASMKTENGLSLNDVLYTGPKLQNNTITLLLNFRLHPIAMTSDVKQMYRQIKVLESHRRYQRILWRFDRKDPISIYQLNTVTFGVKSSPFLSLRTVQQLAQDESSSYSESIVHVYRDMYMDDLICSLPNLEKAWEVYSQLVKLFQSGGFQMVKWMSNSEKLLSRIPDSCKLTQPIQFDRSTVKVLGLQWNPATDKFSFKINFNTKPCTKRNLLSFVARTFDPLGFLSPVTIFVKLLIKKLWELGCDWDVTAPEDMNKLWIKFQNEFNHLNGLEIPRHLLVFERTSVIVIGFSDASSSGYAAVVYVRTVDLSGQVKVIFLCAQSKVAPMTKVTLPRLELSAAVLLSKLIAHVVDTYSPSDMINDIFALSDSMITLHWIHSSPKKWKTFISNRVSKIHSNLAPSHWYFINGKQNVSDCASRGITPYALINHPCWFSGPSWLLLKPADWPIKSISATEDEMIKEECSVYLVAREIISPLYILIEYFSSWTKLLNATVYVLRFIKLLPPNPRIMKSDLDKAELVLIQAVQKKHFQAEYEIISKNKILSTNLRTLNPFIKDNIIRVGGRLSNSNISFEQKHPILLPKSDPFVNLLIDYNHKKYIHTGAHLLQSLLRQNYWILSSRDIIRQRIWKCNHCFKLNPKPKYPMMSDLPFERVNQAKAFLSTGVDFTGAFPITFGRRRGTRSQKAYVCLFICLATKAVHLELASDLSTDAFIAALKRFLSRRGPCAVLFSDCGTNFVGAKKQLNEVYRLIESREYKDGFQRELNNHKIEWKFNPPSAPHFGGIWEANIKSVKSHLARIVGNQILTYEEFITVLAQIEALLNSRPLCCSSSDPNDPIALTPAHFLYGSPLNSFPTEDLIEEPSNRIKRYKLLDSMIQHYWKRWHVEYLSTLQARQKWNTNSNPVKVGMIVIIIKNNIPPLQWPLAIIEKLYPSKDGVVRVVSVRTKNSSYSRPVVKLCPLPNQ